jgi:hypothetical protein
VVGVEVLELEVVVAAVVDVVGSSVVDVVGVVVEVAGTTTTT